MHDDDRPSPVPPTPASTSPTTKQTRQDRDRADRLRREADALRANLRRRKQQSRDRDAARPPADPASAPGPAHDAEPDG